VLPSHFGENGDAAAAHLKAKGDKHDDCHDNDPVLFRLSLGKSCTQCLKWDVCKLITTPIDNTESFERGKLPIE